MKTSERERHDWMMIPILLFFGFLCVILAGGWALRFSSTWELATNMESNLDPNSDFLSSGPSDIIEPVDPAILTQPAWIHLFLTPGAEFSTGTPFPTPTVTSPIETTAVVPAATSTIADTAVPTNTFMPLVWIAPTSTPKRKPTREPTETSIPTSIPTAIPTATFTDIPAPSEPNFGEPNGSAILLGNGSSVTFSLSGFLLDGNTTMDVVYYEKEETSSAGKIHLGAVLIEVYDETTAAWYTIYNWGDGIVDTNASYNNGNSEPDGFPIDIAVLSGTAPLNTGIALDIDAPAIGQGGAIGDLITSIRITSLSNANCDIDSLQMLR